METIKKDMHMENKYYEKDGREVAGLSFVAIIGGVEQLRNPEFWR